MATIGDKIRELRTKRGISQRKLADKIAPNSKITSQTYLSDIERGISSIDAQDLWVIAEALDYPIWAFYPEYKTDLGEEVNRYADGDHEFITFKRKK
jgi:transcriptional regulator with XRE-family HTH domain